MHRTPKLKDQARQLIDSLKGKGIKLGRGESLELVARMNGFPSWNVASAAQKDDGQASMVIEAPIRLWNVLHHHRHGVDAYPFIQEEAPGDEEIEAAINAESSFEPEHDEWHEVRGSEDVVLRIELGKDGARVVPAEADALVRVYEVNMTDHFEYDVPEDVPEWSWIASKSRFAHVDNGGEPGVWEFMVRCDKDAYGLDEIPEALRPHFEAARNAGAIWVLFHQG